MSQFPSVAPVHRRERSTTGPAVNRNDTTPPPASIIVPAYAGLAEGRDPSAKLPPAPLWQVINGNVAGYEEIGGTTLMLIRFCEPPTVRLLTATDAPPFDAGTFNTPSLILNTRIGAVKVPAEFRTTSLPLAFTLIVLTPPPATMELATTVPPFRFRVPTIAPAPPLVRANRSVVLTTTIAPVLVMKLLFTLKVAVAAPPAPVALP